VTDTWTGQVMRDVLDVEILRQQYREDGFCVTPPVTWAADHGSALGHAIRILRQIDELGPELRRVAEPGEKIAQYAFGAPLRDHQPRGVGSVGARLPSLIQVMVLIRALPVVETDGHVEASAGQRPVDHAQVVQHLQSARLHALGARPGRRARCRLDQAEGDAAPGELAGERQSCRPGADDQHLDRRALDRRAVDRGWSGRLSLRGRDSGHGFSRMFRGHIEFPLTVFEKIL